MKKYTILLVDDEVANLKTITAYLEEASEDYHILSTANSQIALRVIQEKELDLVIADWRMPEVSGLDLIQHFRQVHPFKRPPFIVITGTYTRAEDLKRAMDLGAVDFLRKPVNKVELWARVSSVLHLFQSYKVIEQQKNSVLSTKTLKIHEKNQALQAIQGQLEDYLLRLPNSERNAIKEILQTIPLDNQSNQDWENFKQEFDQIHPQFFRTLQSRFPDLRPFELKMCAYIRVGFKIKEIASFLNIQYGGARVQKSRIKKQLGLSDAHSLDDYLRNI